MIKKNNQIRIGNNLFIVENVDNNNYLLKNIKTNTVDWISHNQLLNSLVKLSFTNNDNQYYYNNDNLSITLTENNSQTIIDIDDNGNHFYKIYDNGKSRVLENFSKKFKYLNEITPSKLLKNGFTNNKPIINESFSNQIFYHGSQSKDIKKFNTPQIFWSTSYDFADTYGKWIYKANLDLGKCFDMENKKHFDWLLKKLNGKIQYLDDDYEDQYLVSYNDYKNIKNDNWDTVEQYLNIISSEFNSCKITEGGTVNYIVFDNSQIKLIGNPIQRNLYESSDFNFFIGYHGTNKDFNEFDSKYKRISTFGQGFYFVNDEREAQEYGNIVIKAKLIMNNPLIIKDIFIGNEDVLEPIGIKKMSHLNSDDSLEKIKKAGYDSIIVLNAEGRRNLKYYIVFDNSQIKILEKEYINKNKLNENLSNNIICEDKRSYDVFYHGTHSNFDNFDRNKQYGGFLGNGIYFTLSKSMARSYGPNVISAKLNYNNSFFFNYDVLPSNIVREMLNTSKIDDSKKEKILQNYEELTSNNGIYEANYRLFDIIDFYQGDTTSILQKYGYDSIDNIDRDSEFVVFEPNQVHIISKNDLKENVHYAKQFKNQYGENTLFTIEKNPTKQEFWSLLKNSTSKELRGICGLEPYSNLFVWDAYFGTHQEVYNKYIKGHSNDIDKDFACLLFNTKDMSIFGFTKDADRIKQKYYGSENKKPKDDKWLDKIIADDDLGLLNEDNTESSEKTKQPKFNDAFWKWFGNSVYKDKNGNPSIAYHNSPNKFNEFDTNRIGSRDFGFYGYGIYFSTHKSIASQYGKNQYAVYLKMENPFMFDREYYKYPITQESYSIVKKYEEYNLLTNDELNIVHELEDIINNTKIQEEKTTVIENRRRYPATIYHLQYKDKTYSTDPRILLDEKDAMSQFIYFCFNDILKSVKQIYNVCMRQRNKQFAQMLQKNGYDSIWASTEIVVFNPNQIKSVKNVGTWNPNSNNIFENYDYVDADEIYKFENIVQNHRDLVNYYASKVGKSFPNHDADKFTSEIMIPYIKGFVRKHIELSDKEYNQFKNAQHKHYQNNEHHPEHWDNSLVPNVSGKMPKIAIIEMCADWCAMSKIFGNTPFEWADKNIGKRWIFDNNQIEFIYQTLHKMWDNSSNLLESSYEIKNIKFYENPSLRWIKSQLNKGVNLRIAIDGDLDEPYFGSWIVWDAKLANHQKALQLLGIDEDDCISLQLTKDSVIYWGYSTKQIEKLNLCDKLNQIYPNGYKLENEW